MPECGLGRALRVRYRAKRSVCYACFYFEKGAAYYFSSPAFMANSRVRRDRAVVDHPDARIPVVAEAVEGRSAAATGGPQNQAHRCCPARRIDRLRLYCCAPRSWRAAASSDLRSGRTSNCRHRRSRRCLRSARRSSARRPAVSPGARRAWASLARSRPSLCVAEPPRPWPRQRPPIRRCSAVGAPRPALRPRTCPAPARALP